MHRQISTSELTWIDIPDFAPDDIALLKQQFHFHPLDIAELAKRSPRPKVEEHPGYLFFVIHVPFYDTQQRSTYAAEVDMFVTPTHIITVHLGRIHLLDRFFRDVNEHQEARERYVGRGAAHLLYSIMNVLVDASFPKLDHIGEKISAAEHRIFSGDERSMVYEVSAIQRDLLGFRSIMRPQIHLYDAGTLRGDFANPLYRAVFRSIDAKLARVWDALEIMQERLNILSSTNTTLLTFKLNEFIKMLTLLGALFIPFGLVAQVIVSFNDNVPTINVVIFWIIIAVMLMIDAAVLAYYRKRKLL